MVENVELGGHYPDMVKRRSKGTDYAEVGHMLDNGLPEARERVKLQTEINAMRPGDTMMFVDKTNSARRIHYRRGDSEVNKKGEPKSELFPPRVL